MEKKEFKVGEVFDAGLVRLTCKIKMCGCSRARLRM